MRDKAARRGVRRRGWWTAAALTLCAVVGAIGQERALSTSDGWRQADPAYTIELPRDHASHPDYRVEWWYYTGNADAADGRRFGYQLTLFRIGVDPMPANPSAWAVRDLFMGHFAVVDVGRGRHVSFERLRRAGVGWAGARTDRLEVWNGDWRVERDAAAAVETHRLAATATTDDGPVAIDLELVAERPAVLHGRAGYSQKGREIGNASHYYSLTRMATTGQIVINGEPIAVAGLSWMDHEFGTTFLEAEQQGWDWMSLQLDDGTDLMVYQLRGGDGTPDPQSSGTLVGPDGTIVSLAAGAYRLAPGRDWSSPASGARYPVEWQVTVPNAGLALTVTAAVDAQELHNAESTGITYWEGAVDVTGTRDGGPVSGRGYLEMTGYAGRPMSDVLR